MAKWEYAKNLDGKTLPLVPMICGSGGCSAGDPLVISSGKVILATGGGTDAVPVKYVASEAALDTEEVLCYPCTPTAVFRATGTGTFSNGLKCGIASSTLLPDVSDTTYTKVQLVGQDERDETQWYFVSLGWIA